MRHVFLRRQGIAKAVLLFPEIPSWLVVSEQLASKVQCFFSNPTETSFVSAIQSSEPALTPDEARKLHFRIGSIIKKHTEISQLRRNLSNVVINVTRSCNLRCVYCYNDAENIGSVEGKFLPSGLYEEICHNIAAVSEPKEVRLYISGGEPLLHREIEQLIRISKSLGFFTAMVTNGTLLNHHRMQALESCQLDEIRISMDSITPELHNRYRDNSHARMLRGLESCLAARKRMQVILSATVTQENLGNTEEFMEFAHSRGCGWNFSYLKPTGRASEMAVSYEDIVRVIEKTSCNHSAEKLVRNASCGIARTTICIDCEGNVFPCAQLSSSEFVIGTIGIGGGRDQLKAILAAPSPFTNIHVDRIEGCKDCEIKYLCGGGCRVIGYSETGDFLKRGSDCSLKRNEIYNALFASA
jgi:radical SAM protein with 4Fe4S-binding SPASM domain